MNRILFLFSLLAPLPALADPDSPAEDPAPSARWLAPSEQRVAPLGSKQEFWRIDLGWRGGVIRSAGYAPFSNDSSLTAASLGASRTFFAVDRFSLAAGVNWDISTQTAPSRGADLTFTAQRFSALLEGRVHVLPWLYLFARAAPGAAWAEAQLTDASSFASLADTRWAATFDASGGASILLLPHRSSARTRWWLTFEGGYGLTQAMNFSLKPQTNPQDAANVAPVRLSPVALNGGMYRVTTGVSF